MGHLLGFGGLRSELLTKLGTGREKDPRQKMDQRPRKVSRQKLRRSQGEVSKCKCRYTSNSSIGSINYCFSRLWSHRFAYLLSTYFESYGIAERKRSFCLSQIPGLRRLLVISSELMLLRELHSFDSLYLTCRLFVIPVLRRVTCPILT